MANSCTPRRWAQKSGLRIVVAGLAATYPVGGAFWDYMQYVLGFHRLGHRVLYLEDTLQWCYDPVHETFVEDGIENASYLHQHLRQLDSALSERWFYRDATGRTYGWDWKSVVEFCREADLFLHVSASPLCWLREEYLDAPRIAFVDTDPMYTQASVQAAMCKPEAAARVELVQQKHVCLTFAENIGQPDCRIPLKPFVWLPTRQPIVLDLCKQAWTPLPCRRKVLTTVASWKPTEKDPIVDGITYGGKNVEFERFLALPTRSRLPLEVAIAGRPPVESLTRQGWRLIDAYEVSKSPWRYLEYLGQSFGEFSVAKHAYVASQSGWFSCRTACYLALGVPAVVQETGFSRSIPSGFGLLSFRTMDEAVGRIEQLVAEPGRHSEAAVELAHEYFDSDKVLSQLLQTALA